MLDFKFNLDTENIMGSAAKKNGLVISNRYQEKYKTHVFLFFSSLIYGIPIWYTECPMTRDID